MPEPSRRDILAMLGAGTLAVSAPGAALAAQWIAPLSIVRQLRITAGPLAGAFVVAPAGYVNWYFANLGLYPFVPRMRAEVRAYLTLVLSRLDPVRATIADVLPDYAGNAQAPGIAGLRRQDSDDAYAGTLLALASRYDAVWADDGWWAAHVRTLKRVARCNILGLQSRSGLTRTFQDSRWDGAGVAYLMDNCEVHGGLTQFAARLRARADADAAIFEATAGKVAQGIAGLFDASAGAFRPSDADATVGSRFYPDATAQVFPQLHGVTARGLGPKQYDAAWATLNRIASNWTQGTYDPYPWLLLGLAAAMRGPADKAVASRQLATARALYRKNPALMTIDEIGYYARTSQALVA